MSRILLLIVVIVWTCRSIEPPAESRVGGPLDGILLFIGGFALVVLLLGVWSRVLARNIHTGNLQRSLKRFHNSLFAARMLIPVWFGVGIFALGWSRLVSDVLAPLDDWPVELPGMILGTLPPFLAWAALWWAQWPADRALREQSMLVHLNEDLPIHHPPGFWTYFASNLRLQLLFIIVPISLILLVRDVASLAVFNYGGINLQAHAQQTPLEENVELFVHLGAIVLVVMFAPEVLRRVLSTQPLPEGPLRARLERMCRATGLRYREILLWKTNHNMGNAAVMGLIPRMRYILLSDVLLETMTDRQIEAVFAHEIGHVKHWHLGWYIVFFATAFLLAAGPGQTLGTELDKVANPAWVGYVSGTLCIGGLIVAFGFLSRWFERQADVFAARTMQQHDGATVGLGSILAASRSSAVACEATASLGGATSAAMRQLTSPPESFVGAAGAASFASALQRVAMVNNMPIAARNFTHGSIAERMRYLADLSADPVRTIQFDRSMSILYALLVLALLASSAWVLVSIAA